MLFKVGIVLLCGAMETKPPVQGPLKFAKLTVEKVAQWLGG